MGQFDLNWHKHPLMMGTQGLKHNGLGAHIKFRPLLGLSYFFLFFFCLKLFKAGNMVENLYLYVLVCFHLYFCFVLR